MDCYRHTTKKGNHQSIRIRPQVTPTCVKLSTLRLLRRTRRHYYNNFLSASNSEDITTTVPFRLNSRRFFSQAARNALSYRAELLAAPLTQFDQLLALIRSAVERAILLLSLSFVPLWDATKCRLPINHSAENVSSDFSVWHSYRSCCPSCVWFEPKRLRSLVPSLAMARYQQ